MTTLNNSFEKQSIEYEVMSIVFFFLIHRLIDFCLQNAKSIALCYLPMRKKKE